MHIPLYIVILFPVIFIDTSKYKISFYLFVWMCFNYHKTTAIGSGHEHFPTFNLVLEVEIVVEKLSS